MGQPSIRLAHLFCAPRPDDSLTIREILNRAAGDFQAGEVGPDAGQQDAQVAQAAGRVGRIPMGW